LSSHSIELKEAVDVKSEQKKSYEGVINQLKGVFVGRFQPIHLGHVKLITDIYADDKDIDKLFIVIGSSRKSHTPMNPFTAGERYTMIDEALAQYGIPDEWYDIIPIADANEGTIWRQRVINHLPKFHVVFTHIGEGSRLFREEGYEIREHKGYKRDIFSGTLLRDMIVNDEKWFKLTTDSVASYIRTINGVARVKELSGKI